MRTRSRGGVATAAAILLVVLGACSSSPHAVEAPPRALNALEASSEDVIDQVPKGRWARIEHAVSEMQRDWGQYRRSAATVDRRQATRLAVALRSLASNAAAHDGIGTTQAANDVSAPVVELLDHYSIGHPVQVGRLDVIGRQVVIDVRRSDDDRVRHDVDGARREWTALRRSVERHHGTRVAARTDEVMGGLLAATTALDGRALERNADELLVLVDRMERLYRRTGL
jgi:hypothetical protein